jgi:hypothetical protein
MNAPKKLVAGLAGVLLIVAGSAAYAAIPDGGGVIHGCYKKDSGAVRVTDSDTNAPKGCNDKEVALNWNQQGPQGETGPSDAYWNPQTIGAQVLAPSWPGSQIASSSVPAGSYMFSASMIGKAMNGTISPQHFVTCRLVAHDNATNNDFYYSYSTATVASDANGDTMSGTIALSIGRTIGQAGGTIGVYCISPIVSQVSSVQLWALKVGKLH